MIDGGALVVSQWGRWMKPTGTLMRVELERKPKISHPLMMVTTNSAALVTQVAALTTSTEHAGANPMLDEWIMLARALLDVMNI